MSIERRLDTSGPHQTRCMNFEVKGGAGTVLLPRLTSAPRVVNGTTTHAPASRLCPSSSEQHGRIRLNRAGGIETNWAGRSGRPPPHHASDVIEGHHTQDLSGVFAADDRQPPAFGHEPLQDDVRRMIG